MKNKLPENNNRESGQVVLIILLAMAVILTIGLSIASRSVTDVKISQESQESARALWAAQAGLEQAIKADSAESGNFDTNSVTYSVTRTEIGKETQFIYPEKVSADETKVFWLVGHILETGEIDTSQSYSGNHLTVYFGDANNPPAILPAIEVSLVKMIGNDNKYVSERFVFDPDAGRRVTSNFAPTSSGKIIKNVNFAYAGDFPVAGGVPYLLQFKILFTDAQVPVALEAQNFQNNDHPLQSQGKCFESTGTVVVSGITKKLVQCQSWEATPPIFNNLLFSGTNI